MAVTAMVVFGGPKISLLHKGLKDIIVVLVLPSSLFVAICCNNGQTQEDGQPLYPDVNISLRPGVG